MSEQAATVIAPPPASERLAVPGASPDLDLSFVDQAVERLGRDPDACIPVLQAIQQHYHYLPQAALKRVCQITRITPAQLTGVATFYTQFRHSPCGKQLVRVCVGTACHVRGADLVQDALHHHLGIPKGSDTDPQGQFTVEPVACMGCCTLAPVVQIEDATYGHLIPSKVPDILRDFEKLQREKELLRRSGGGNGQDRNTEGQLDLRQGAQIRVGLGSCCMVKGSDDIFFTMRQAVKTAGVEASVKRVGCVGMCHQTPMIEVRMPGQEPAVYTQVRPEEARGIVRKHFRPAGWLRKAAQAVDGAMERLFVTGEGQHVERHPLHTRDAGVNAFMGPQIRIATEHFGDMDPLDLDEYLAHQGFGALARTIAAGKPEEAIATIKASGVRGRGGAGFPTGLKWERVRAAAGDTKYVICNGDEGDPGAFMDRMLLESFPYRVLEGLMTAAFAVGAHEGYFYIRAEYPLAVQRVRYALAQCRKRGILGDNVLGTGWRFEARIKEGAGAFVCGEETALIASIEGQRGMPRLRPPFPADSGLWGKPTCVNNVETLALVPWIMRHGAAEFAKYGTKTSKGTKVFALAGKVERGGLIEVPMGITIRQIVEEIGGGCPRGPDGQPRRFKAVQIGGPSGGCVPAALADTVIDYEALASVGAIMGSGGLVVLDDGDCMVDIARYFLSFTQDQSCGKCTFCRVGTRRMLDILERLCAGKGRPSDPQDLEQLARMVGAGSLCGLGKTAPNPVLTTLKYFRDEYEAHLQGRCPAGRCKALIKYVVTDACIGCTRCATACPADAIPYTPFQKHWIDMSKCTCCDTCRNVCPVADGHGNDHGGAILVQ